MEAISFGITVMQLEFGKVFHYLVARVVHADLNCCFDMFNSLLLGKPLLQISNCFRIRVDVQS